MDGRGAGPVPDGRGGPHVFVADLDSPRFDEDDYHHLARVLRLRDGAPMTIGDGRGAWRLARFRLDLGVGPEPDGEVAAGTEAESARIVELLKEKRGGESLPFGDGQLAAVAEEMARDSLSATMLRERFLGGANMVEALRRRQSTRAIASFSSSK